MPRRSTTSESGGTSAAPRPRDRRKPSSTRANGTSPTRSRSAALSCPAQTRIPRPSAFARITARAGSSAKRSRLSAPKKRCRCGRFQSRMPVATWPARSARWARSRASRWSTASSKLHSRSRQGSYHVGARIIAAAKSWARVRWRSRRGTGFSSWVRPQPE